MLKLFLTILLTISCGVIMSQDTIYKTNGDIVAAKISEVSPTEIKFKRFDMPDGPNYIELKSNIVKVKYSSGIIDTYPTMQTPTDDYVSNETKNYKIEFKGGRYYYGNEIYSEKGIQKILINTKDKQINDLVKKSKQAHAMQFIGFAAFPLGLTAFFFLDLGLEGGEPSGYGIAGVLAAATIAAPIISGVYKMKRKELNAHAVALFNAKLP